MQIQTSSTVLPVSDGLIVVLQLAIEIADTNDELGLVVHFRDPNYSREMGGFHPVEIALNACGELLYITDFAYVGTEPFIELAKELDFDFQCGRFQQFSREYPLREGRAMFELWQSNFLTYLEMDAYEITVEGL